MLTLLFVLLCLIPEILTILVFIIALVITNDVFISFLIGALIYAFLALTVKREVK